jgi:hypothetical protein
MEHNKVTGRVLTAKEMKGITGGEGVRRKNVCVICGPGDVHCTSVLWYFSCVVHDFSPATDTQGDITCTSPYDSGLHEPLEHSCVNP